MDAWMQGLISRNGQLRGPALVGLLAEAIEEFGQLPDELGGGHADGTDPAVVAFQGRLIMDWRADKQAAYTRPASPQNPHKFGSSWPIPTSYPQIIRHSSVHGGTAAKMDSLALTSQYTGGEGWRGSRS
jgi:hypothetical protein